jgi:23S rRNA (uracil1939-C5)-methyltransferase
VILDAYCGIGTIGLIASKHVKSVDGVEVVEEAIIDAKNNAKLNDIKNCNFVCKDAADYLIDKKFDVVFVDPPRKGLDAKFLNGLIKSKPEKIVYISCDVGTLSRDLDLMKKNYDIKSIDFVDMFPRTYHVETVVLLTKK